MIQAQGGDEEHECTSEAQEEIAMKGTQRFVRVVSGKPPNLSLADTPLLGERVPWLKRLVVHKSLTTKLSHHSEFEDGHVIGMDAASALVVEALDPQPGLRILDLCCAPGVKMAAIADLMGRRGVLMGVDVSIPRLNTTAALLRKYKVCLDRVGEEDGEAEDGSIAAPYADEDWDVKVWQCDGRLFKPGLHSGTLTWSTAMNAVFLSGKPLRVPRKRAGKALRKVLGRQATEEVNAFQKAVSIEFDRVLVDAECTTDGRAHVASAEEQSYKKKRWTGEEGVASDRELKETEQLQLDLLINGFRLLKPGGFLVYSTCSMLEGQNESVMKRFLDQEPSAKLVPPFACAADDSVTSVAVPSHTLGGLGWRLTPEASGTSGIFFAKVSKLEPSQ